MALSFLDNVDYRGKKPNFTRDLFDTIADMVAFSENYLPDVFIACNKEDGNLYIFNRNNTVDTTFGKWRQFEGGSTGSGDWDSLIGKPFKDIDGNVFTIDENGVLSVVIPEVPIEIIKVNDVELDIDATDKSVNIVVPTLTSELTNDSEFVSDTDYVHTDNNFTTEEKNKLELLENYDDSALTEKIQAIEDDYLTSVQKEELVNSIAELDTKITDGLEEKLDAVQSVDNAGKFLVVGDDGTVTFAEPSAASGDSAENIAYVNDGFPDYTNVGVALDTILAKIYYVAPKINSFTMTPSTTEYEIGTVINELAFAWTVNKEITSQTLTDCTIAVDDRSSTYSNPISSTKTFSLAISDGENTASSSKKISFLPKIYYGSTTEPTEYNSVFALDLSNSVLSSSVKRDYSFNCGSGEYSYIICPTSCSFDGKIWVNGFQADMQEQGIISLTNASGYTQSYDVWRFANHSLGSFVGTVK